MATQGWWSQLAHGSTKAITYTIHTREEHHRGPHPSLMAVTFTADPVRTVPLDIIRCFHCSRYSRIEHYYQGCEDILAALLMWHFPYMTSLCLERVVEQVLPIVEWANASYRCHNCHPDQVNCGGVRIHVQPLLGLGGSNEEEEKTNDECVICMEEIETLKSAMWMPCSHVFHEACLVQWLNNSPVCPLCRYEMP